MKKKVRITCNSVAVVHLYNIILIGLVDGCFREREDLYAVSHLVSHVSSGAVVLVTTSTPAQTTPLPSPLVSARQLTSSRITFVFLATSSSTYGIAVDKMRSWTRTSPSSNRPSSSMSVS